MWGCVFLPVVLECSDDKRRGAFVLGRRSSDGRHSWLRLGLGMLNGGREGLFELGQQLQQQGEYQAALHCFLSCLLGLTHVQSFTSLPNCLHQVSRTPRCVSLARTHVPTCMRILQHVRNLFHAVDFCSAAALASEVSHVSAQETHSTLTSVTPMSNLIVHHGSLCQH